LSVHGIVVRTMKRRGEDGKKPNLVGEEEKRIESKTKRGEKRRYNHWSGFGRVRFTKRVKSGKVKPIPVQDGTSRKGGSDVKQDNTDLRSDRPMSQCGPTVREKKV